MRRILLTVVALVIAVSACGGANPVKLTKPGPSSAAISRQLQILYQNNAAQQDTDGATVIRNGSSDYSFRLTGPVTVTYICTGGGFLRVDYGNGKYLTSSTCASTAQSVLGISFTNPDPTTAIYQFRPRPGQHWWLAAPLP